MVPEEKRAWFGLALFGVSVVAFLALLPFVGISVAWGGFGRMGLYGLSPILFKKAPTHGEVAEDERDKRIAVRANMAGHVLAYGFVCLACLVPWGVFKAYNWTTIDINLLPNVVVAGLIGIILGRCLAFVIYYRRGIGHDEA